MSTVAWGFGIAVAGVILFLAWRMTSVRRGAEARDRRLMERLDPVAERFARKLSVAPEEIAALATAPELRPMLYAMLHHHQKLALFPAEYLSGEAQAASQLAYWMLHPNELQDAPAAMALEEKLERPFRGKPAVFYVFRYKMPDGHWAGPEWELGLAGPFFPDDAPYQGMAGGFARVGDRVGTVKPAELVDWYLDMPRRKGVA